MSNTPLVLQLLLPSILSGMKIEDALEHLVQMGGVSPQTAMDVKKELWEKTGGDIDRWMTSKKEKPSVKSRMAFLREFQ